MIGDFLVDDANQVRALLLELEGEVAFGVGLGATGFFHSVAEGDEDHFVSGAGLAGGGVLYDSGEGLSRGCRGQEQDEEHGSDPGRAEWLGRRKCLRA